LAGLALGPGGAIFFGKMLLRSLPPEKVFARNAMERSEGRQRRLKRGREALRGGMDDEWLIACWLAASRNSEKSQGR